MASTDHQTSDTKLDGDQVGAEPEIVELSELDFDDDDMPTAELNLRAVGATPVRTPYEEPSSAEEGNIYLLTKERLRYRGGILPIGQEHVDIREILRIPAELPALDIDQEEMEATVAESPVIEVSENVQDSPRGPMSSVAPVSMNASPQELQAQPSVQHTHPAYAATVAALAVAAAAIMFVRPMSTSFHPQTQPVAESLPVAAQLPAQLASPTREPHEVSLVEIVAGPTKETSVTAPHQDSPPKGTAPSSNGVQTPVDPQSPPIVESQVAPEADDLPALAPPEVQLGPFDRSAASAALAAAASAAAGCREDGTPSAPVSVNVTFAPTGVVTTATVDSAPYAGTRAGGCIAKAFRSARVNPFGGGNVSVHKTFQLP